MTKTAAKDTGKTIISDDEAAKRLASTAVISYLLSMKVGGLRLSHMKDRRSGCDYGYGQFAQASKATLDASFDFGGNDDVPDVVSALIVRALQDAITMKIGKRLKPVYFCANEDESAREDIAERVEDAADDGFWEVYNWAEAQLRKHARTVETIAAMLLKQGLLDAEEVGILLQPLKTPEAFQSTHTMGSGRQLH